MTFSSPTSALFPPKTFEQQEARADEEATPETSISFLSPKEAVVPSPLSMADDFTQFQDLSRKISDTLQIPLKEVKDPEHKLLDILTSASVVLPINKALLHQAKTVWQTPPTILPNCKRADKKYYVPYKDSDFLFSYPLPNSLVVDAVNECSRHYFSRSTY